MDDLQKAEEILQKLTLDEKISMIHGAQLFQTAGVERLGIPPLKMSDGPKSDIAMTQSHTFHATVRLRLPGTVRLLMILEVFLVKKQEGAERTSS